MKFGTFPVEAAEGLILGHTIRGANVLKKGHVITSADIAALKAGGIAVVVGARLDPDDVGEDAAAAQIASRLCGPHVRMSGAHTGRCNLVAAENGVMVVDKAAIEAANRVHEAVTIATLPDMASVATGQIVATIKIIPFAVAAGVLASVEKILAEGCLRVAPFQPKKFALISTLLPGLKPSVVSGTEEVLQRRIAEINGVFERTVRIPHEEAAVAAETRGALRTIPAHGRA